MELNAIVDEVAVKKSRKKAKENAVPILEDGTSTIFENGEQARKVMAGESVRNETVRFGEAKASSGTAQSPEQSAEPAVQASKKKSSPEEKIQDNNNTPQGK